MREEQIPCEFSWVPGYLAAHAWGNADAGDWGPGDLFVAVDHGSYQVWDRDLGILGLRQHAGQIARSNESQIPEDTDGHAPDVCD